MTPDPSYDINKENIKQEYQSYDNVIPDKFVHLQDNKQDTIKLDTNPSLIPTFGSLHRFAKSRD